MSQTSDSQITPEPVAIIGIGCQFPGDADGPETFWANLCTGVNGIVEIPPDRWNLDGFYDPDPDATARSVTKWGGFVKDIALFDAQFFGISPREAADMDPQQRLMLHVAWEAMEDAGVAPDRLAGSPTGVFVGVSINDYAFLQRPGRGGEHIHAGTGTALSIVANRISHRLDLRGPSISVDTACSSSLVAVDLACRALSAGECTLALAGGVNALLDPGGFLFFSKANMMSPDGRLSAFDARANGFVRAEGAGVVVLKRLSAARADRDRVYAVIRATAVNQDGRTSTITVPSRDAQVAMLREACRRAGTAPEAVSYVEAHGTGTQVGDPIEAAAIGEVFGAARPRHGPKVLVGSVKTSTGHLESAAGITGLIKTALCLHHRAVPANLNFDTPSPQVPLDDLHLRVPRELTPLDGDGAPLLAAVNSFGFGGTNACAVLEAEPPVGPAPEAKGRRLWLVPLSAATPTALAARAARLAQALAGEGGDGEATTPALRDVAGTAALRRAHLSHRLAVVASSSADLAAKLDAFVTGQAPAAPEGVPACVAGRREDEQPLTFVFPGQGGQSWRMARELLEHDGVFRATVERFDEVFRTISGWSIIPELLRDEAGSRIHETQVTQPAIFAVQIGLVARWREWGITPDAVIGHSFGEVAAAHTAGALSLEDAAAIIYHRGRLQDATQGRGGMAAVGASRAEIEALLADLAEDRVEIAAVNAPGMVTLAGEHAGLERVIEALRARDPDLFSRILQVDYAAHSRQMEAIRDEFVASLAGLRPGPPALLMISTVTAAPVDAAEVLNADYWWRNVRLPVLFQGAAERASDLGHRAFVEIGPHATLSGPLSACMAHRGLSNGVVVPSLHAKHQDLDVLHAALGTLYVRGFPLAWERVADPAYEFIRLPGYPWEKLHFWSDSEEGRAARFDAPVHPLLGVRLRTAQPIWAQEIDLDGCRFLADHRVDGAVVFPATGYIEMMFAAAREVLGEAPWELEDVTFHEALFLGEDRSVLMQTVYEAERSTVRISSRMRDGSPEWTLRATARARRGSWRPPVPATLCMTERAQEEPVARDAFYAYTHRRGHEYGPLFQGIEGIWPGAPDSIASVVLPESLTGVAERFLCHPALLDACLQVGIGFHGITEGEPREQAAIYLPTSMARVRLFRRPGPRLRAHARLVHQDDRSGESALTVADEGGDVALVIEGFRSRRLAGRAARADAAVAVPAYYQDAWQEAALERAGESGDGDTPAAADAGTWLLLTDRGGVGDRLAVDLAASGQRCIRVTAGAGYRWSGRDRVEIRAHDGKDMTRLLAEVADGSWPALAGVVHLWTLDTASDLSPAVTADDLMAAQTAGSQSVLRLVQSLAQHEALAPRLWLVTSGLRILDGDAPPPLAGAGIRLAHAPLAGLARTIASEYGHLRCTVVDLDPAITDGDAGPTAAAHGLLAEILADLPEPEVVLRGDRRWVNRVDRVAPEAIPPLTVPAAAPGDQARPFRLTMSAPGVLENMIVVETDPGTPGPGEIAIEVRAVGLNFHDILSASGLMPEGAEAIDAWEHLGLECAGVVAAVGDGVSAWRQGDRVMAPGDGCLRRTVIVPAALARPLPEGLGFVEAATVPTAFMTAYYALEVLAGMAEGERVLIHVATGGVGLAAIQLARLKGAEIFATAGNERKRAYLRELGIRHVMDSRSLEFADEVMAATGGRGVDIVLNSLPGAFIDKGLAILAPYGRFLELGKRDLFADKAIGLRALRNNNMFLTVDLDGLGRERPEQFCAVFDEVAGRLAEGRLKPLPAETFPISRVVDAFRHMSQARHIGKVVVTLDDPELRVALAPERPAAFRADGSYLVTGGLSGFGLEVARWLAAQGAGHLVLMSRSGAASEEARAAVEAMQVAGAEVTVVRGDVTRRTDVDQAIARAMTAGRPLRGVVHAAMVLDDGFLSQLDDARFERALAPKMLGAWNLHEATREAAAELDFFVMFSSVAALLGSTGQGNYVAGNAFLDALASWRRAHGLPALSVAWGALGGAGFVARNEAVARYLESLGIAPLGLDEALGALGRLLRQDAGAVAFAKIDWNRLAKASDPMSASPRIAHLLARGGEGQAVGGRIRGELLAAPAARRPAMLGKFLREQVARVLRVEAAKIETERPLSELGLDSLTSFELKNRIETELGVSLPAGKFLQKPTVVSLSEAILEKLESEPGVENTANANVEETDGHPLSYRQEWVWRHYQSAREITAFHRDYQLAFAISVEPRLDVPRIRQAFNHVTTRHAALRTTFAERGGRPVQRIADCHPLELEARDTTVLTNCEFRDVLDAALDEPYDLEKGPLVRLLLYHRPDNRDVLLFRVHHNAVDGWSLMLLVSEMFSLYIGTADQQDLAVGPTRYGYTDFARWQRAMVNGAEGMAHLEYWRGKLKDPGPPFELPVDRPRSEGSMKAIRRGAYHKFIIDPQISAATAQLAADKGTTRYTVLLGAFKALIHACTGRRDLMISASVAGRTRPEFERVIGWLSNNVVLRSDLDPDTPFCGFLMQLDEALREALEHQDYPITELLAHVAPEETHRHTCLDQVAFFMMRPDNLNDRGFGLILHNTDDARMEFGNIRIESVPLKDEGCSRDLTFFVQEYDGRIYASLNYNADLFEPATIERLAAQYETVLHAAVADPDQPVARLADLCRPDALTDAAAE